MSVLVLPETGRAGSGNGLAHDVPEMEREGLLARAMIKHVQNQRNTTPPNGNRKVIFPKPGIQSKQK
eukprot:1453745-Amphidinium_carterae.1